MSSRSYAGTRGSLARGFTLIELVIAVAIVGILAAIAMPNYRNYMVRASREAVQGELLRLASVQERIYLNSNGYAASIAAAYTGTAAGGLGRTSGRSEDGKYDYSITPATQTTPPIQTYTLTATPKTGSTQAGDGSLTVDSTGNRVWNSTSGAKPW